MEENGESGRLDYNKRRAEGGDRKDDEPKVQKLNSDQKTKKGNPLSTTCYVQILGTGLDTQDTPSILLFFDDQRGCSGSVLSTGLSYPRYIPFSCLLRNYRWTSRSFLDFGWERK
ncbi:tRNAse Z TRZ4, mitochondrial-like [Papaver somniferum]|uniref:tRNAse Z TRZ4, mitochondrial-like n=1 Tax=Papaver somniferum TaxID=3469 RepID=UPI000E705DE8|nr:tRNAse Z TRZ4, mitochondrial-like [Papaver somniferum]